MIKRIAVFFALTLILTLMGCSSPPPAQPTQTAAPVVPTATTQAAIPTTAPATTVAPTAVLPTQIATITVAATNTTAPTAVPISNADATATWAGMDEIMIYVVAMEDNGVSGPKIGCGDSIIGVRRPVPPTQSPLRVAMQTMVALNDQYFGESGYYNALHHYDLTVDDVNIRADGTAVIFLSGEFFGIGTCEDPRIQAQLEYTALQFSTVKDVEIYINGELLDDLFDMSG